MKEVDFGRDFNRREYWKYDIQVKMGILKVLQDIRDAQGGWPTRNVHYIL